MKAKIKLTVNGRTFQPGERITEKIGEADKAFLLREGYAEKEGNGVKAENKETGKKPPVTAEVS